MVSNYLYTLCKFITSNFKSENLPAKNNHSFINFHLYESLTVKSNFYYIWGKKLNHKYINSKFKYKYKVLEQYNDLLKIKLSIINSFFIELKGNMIQSASIDDYLLIIECTKNSLFNTLILIPREENELNYNKYITKDLSSISNNDFKMLTFNNLASWNEKIKNIDKLYTKFKNKFASDRFSYSKYNVTNALNYAEKYALVPNNNYKNFNDSGGDCTNFVSQILHAGGIPLTNTWKPYSNSWIRVGQLYNYIIKNNIGRKLSDNSPYIQGSVIQFYTPQKGYYFHSGFISYVLPSNDALYCCHSYNKLNYPLSKIYPIIYPTIRCIVLN